LAKVSAYPAPDLIPSPSVEQDAPSRHAFGAPPEPWAARSETPKTSRIPELDGLRGFAISIVVAYHYFYFSPPVGYHPQSLPARLYANFENCIALGWSGVDLFFVLSGFLIGGILLDARHSPRYFRAFYARRFFRIIPIYYIWTAAFVVASLALAAAAGAFSPDIRFPWQMIPMQLLFLQNMGLVGYSTLARPWFEPTWSLAVEEQFYLVSPLVVKWLSKKTLYAVLALVIVATPFFRISLQGATFRFANAQDWPYTLMFSRADALCIGILVALLWKDADIRQWLRSHSNAIRLAAGVFAAGVVALALWSPSFRSWPMQSVGYTWMGLFYSMVLLLVLANPLGILGSIARVKILREIGKISYCLYLIHQMAGLAVQAILHRLFGTPGAALAVAGYAFAAVAAYAFAQASWKYFERPLVERGHSIKY